MRRNAVLLQKGKMRIEKIKLVNGALCAAESRKDRRIYFGDEFCQNKMPSVKDLRVLLKNGRGKVTLVFPYITQSRFKDAAAALKFARENCSVFDEIVFNDWGMFFYIRENYPGAKLVLGRLLTKQKTDPFAEEIIANRQKAVFKNNVFVPKKVSSSAAEYFGETFINSEIFHGFMSDNNIVRVELDNLAWNMKVRLPSGVKASLYYPYVKISTTRFCGYLNMSEKDCAKRCLREEIKLAKYRTSYDYVVKANAVFYKNRKLPPAKLLAANCVDRIILNDK